MSKLFTTAMVTVLFCSVVLRAQRPAATPASPAAQQTESDEYTRYELLAPESASFKIYYEVTATAPGAKVFFNPIRKGSIASDEKVTDLATGAPLAFKVVSGESAKTTGMPDADPSYDYIRVELAHPVPADGGVFFVGKIPCSGRRFLQLRKRRAMPEPVRLLDGAEHAAERLQFAVEFGG